jgi:hypothetical protein
MLLEVRTAIDPAPDLRRTKSCGTKVLGPGIDPCGSRLGPPRVPHFDPAAVG